MRLNLLRLLFLLSLFFQANHVCLYSQTIDYIDGKIINNNTSEPVRFATVLLKQNKLGVYANADGDFKIIKNSEFQSDSLIITCIGFKRHSLAYKDLSDKIVNMIYLTPSMYGLDEVKIIASRRKLGSATIIRRAIRNIKNNYPDQPFSYISYYRDYQKKEGNYINLNEAIVHTLDNGFNKEEVLNKYRLLDFRKNMDFPRMNISPYYDSIDLPFLILLYDFSFCFPQIFIPVIPINIFLSIIMPYFHLFQPFIVLFLSAKQ
ncbi:MAG TPA: carboxypeptidase-like regulatory domain-containing protein, partial [Bacteroidales bacterium]|nr:carboxypeptidase-like regulatory domain-containing protein [Bacteroidales bacterium]